VFGFDLNTFFQQINAVLIVLAAKASFGRRQRTENSEIQKSQSCSTFFFALVQLCSSSGFPPPVAHQRHLAAGSNGSQQ